MLMLRSRFGCNILKYTDKPSSLGFASKQKTSTHGHESKTITTRLLRSSGFRRALRVLKSALYVSGDLLVDTLVVNHQRPPVHDPTRNLLQRGMCLTLLIIVCHVLLVLEDRDNRQSVTLRSLVWKCLARLNVDDVWLAVLRKG